MKKIMLISAAILALAGCKAPQLGKSSVDKVLKAMTLEEKVHFVIGTGMAGLDDENAGAAVGATRNIVPGAAGTTYPIERLGIPSIVLADGPAGLRIDPTREGDENTYYCNGAHGSRSPAGKIGFVVGTGAFYTRPSSTSYILTYPEMCFIKAEILFNKGDKNGAYTAYINGIKAHFELMNQKLTEWQGAGYCTTAKGFDVSFAYAPMTQSSIDAYMRSEAVKQSSAALTLSDIMMQKYIAMGPDLQKYDDVRKYNYWRDGVYTEMKVPAYRTATGFNSDPSKQTYYMRRWQQSSHETNYNATNVEAIYEQYRNYVTFSTDVIALAPQVWSIPVWWDME